PTIRDLKQKPVDLGPLDNTGKTGAAVDVAEHKVLNEGSEGFSHTPGTASALLTGNVGTGSKSPLAARMGLLESPQTVAARKALTAQATEAAAHAVAAGNPQHPLLEKFGDALGMALGVVVTEALALVPSWNTRVLDQNGKPATSVPGADRIGDHDILKRHQEVVGPQIEALVEKMAPGAVHDLLAGLARGATAAPGTSYRIEAAVEDALKP
ncbi:MAG TPA: hypothetical protein VGO62_20065, partial [Myxococcota bacterium]